MFIFVLILVIKDGYLISDELKKYDVLIDCWEEVFFVVVSFLNV